MATLERITSADAIAALGGGHLRPTLARANGAITRFHETGAGMLIFSGGVEINANGQLLSEADVMRNWALDHQIPVEKTIVETASVETISNAYWIKKLAEQHGWNNLGVVTSNYHKVRTAKIFEHVFGPDYKLVIEGVPGLCGPTRAAKEIVGQQLVRYTFWDIEPGNDEAIMDWLGDHHPKHVDLTPGNLVMEHVVNIVVHLLPDSIGKPQTKSA